MLFGATRMHMHQIHWCCSKRLSANDFTELYTHYAKAKFFFDELREKIELAEDNPHIETLWFDHEHNAALPKVPSYDAFYLR